MKKLGFFGKLLFWVNSLVVFLLFLSFFLPYIPPTQSPTLALLSLGVSPLLWLNFFFLVYWLLRRKRVFLLSAIGLVIAYFVFNPFYKFSSSSEEAIATPSIEVLSYNVRLFNLYEEGSIIDKSSEALTKILADEQPDVVCIQEYYRKHTADLSQYPFRYEHFKEKNVLGHAIFSKYPIINQGAFDFDGTFNNSLYVDIKVANDTLRVYNIHLQSMGIKASVEGLQDENRERTRKRLTSAFIKQEHQAKELIVHKDKSPYPVIIAGDLNNTPFSYVYRSLHTGMLDTFLEKGSGLGATFTFDFYPMRIDYIFTSENFEVVSFRRLENGFSDHKPIISTLTW